MTVLVTGGAGFIGRHLTDALRRAGHQVRVLDVLPAEGEAVEGSMADMQAVARAVRGVDRVYHLAWAFRPRDERGEVQENLLGTLNLLQAALIAGVRHLVFASSAVVYGPTSSGRADEEHPCHAERSTIGGAMYGITKLACEKLCLVYHRRGLPTTIFRMHGVFREGRLGPFEPMIERALDGEAVTAIRGAGGEYAHVDDVVSALVLALERPEAQGRVFNLAGTHTYRDPDLAHVIVEAAGSGSRVVLVDDPGQGMVSVSIDRARRVLGFEPEQGEFLTGLIERAVQRAQE